MSKNFEFIYRDGETEKILRFNQDVNGEWASMMLVQQFEDFLRQIGAISGLTYIALSEADKNEYKFYADGMQSDAFPEDKTLYPADDFYVGETTSATMHFDELDEEATYDTFQKAIDQHLEFLKTRKESDKCPVCKISNSVMENHVCWGSDCPRNAPIDRKNFSVKTREEDAD